MAKKKIKEEDEKYQVVDLSLKVEKMPIHQNEQPMERRLKQDGTTELYPPDPYYSVRMNGFDDVYLGYVIQARQYVKDIYGNWGKSKKWEVVGYLLQPSFRVYWLKRSQWLSDQVGQLVLDVQNFEAVMTERIKHHHEEVAAKMKAWKEEQDAKKAAKQ